MEASPISAATLKHKMSSKHFVRHNCATVTSKEEGSSKRNIVRRGGSSKAQRRERGNRHDLDDGTLYTTIALDGYDPNYDADYFSSDDDLGSAPFISSPPLANIVLR